MTEMLRGSSDIALQNSHEGEQSERPSSPLQQNTVNHYGLRRHLSRTITQPRGLYEAILDTYGPINAPDVLQAEASEVDEAYKTLQASCSSDTETCSSYEDGQETHFDPVNDRKDAAEIREARDHNGQSSRTRRSRRNEPRSESQKRSDQEWTKSILSRRTGYGCLQRNQVVKYISQLESSLVELQMEVSSLSPQVILLDQRRWVLQGENDSLKQKIAELSRYQLIKEDRISALQKGLKLLRIQQADQLERAERLQQDSHPTSSEEVPHAGHGNDGEARGDHASVQEPSHDQRSLPDDTQTTKDVLEGLLHEPSEPSTAHQADTTSLRRSPRPQKEPQEDGKVTRQLSLVKWPSSLYRSVSAIRKDVLEVAIEKST